MEEKCFNCGQMVKMRLNSYNGHVEEICPNCNESSYSFNKSYKLALIKRTLALLLMTFAH